MWDGSQWAIYDMHNSPLPVLSTGQDVGISAVEVDPFNNVWFGTRGRGAARLDGYNTWTLFSPSEGWTGPASIEAIGFDKKGSGWLASCNQPGGAHEILLGNSSRGIVTPGAGGVVYAPDRTGRIAFLPGAVNQPVAVTYQKADPASSPGYIAVRTFDLTAVVSGTTTPVTQFNKPYTMTMSYMPESLGFTDESTLGIYQQVGAAWQRLPTSQLDAARDRVEATLDHLSRFAVLGTIQQVYLPLLER